MNTYAENSPTRCNLQLFGMLHRMEGVEHIGSGIRGIRRLCRDYGVSEPEFEVSEHWVTTIFQRPIEQSGAQGAAQVILFCDEPRAAREIMSALGLKHWKTFQSNYLKPLLKSGWLEATIPDKPTSPNQKYRITDRSKALLAQLEDEQQ
ncbi:MAG: Fic family protein [Sedimenticola sp.]